MKDLKSLHIVLLLCFCTYTMGQQASLLFEDAHELVYEGNHSKAKKAIETLLDEQANHLEARKLLARTLSWEGNYEQARKEFNHVLSMDKDDRQLWIAAIKNELYANENYIALGLAYKALDYISNDSEVSRLLKMAHSRVEKQVYPEYKEEKNTVKNTEKESVVQTKKKEESKPLNRISVDNMVTVFDQRFDPMFFSGISYKRQTKYGSIIPRINFSNRLGTKGVQYDIDLYPKFLKRFYAYLNYGYSNSTIYPRQKVGGDIYVNLPKAIELSFGGRYIQTNTREIRGITNSIGHYRGNYYFSLRSFVTPESNGLTRISGNLLVRKYLKDAENYFGISAGMGVEPELRQFFSADETLLAETILFIESQRLNIEYQFTGKSKRNIYRARVGVRRQELAFDTGNFFWGVSAGVTYNVKF